MQKRKAVERHGGESQRQTFEQADFTLSHATLLKPVCDGQGIQITGTFCTPGFMLWQ